MKTRRLFLFVALVVLAGRAGIAQGDSLAAPAALQQGDRLFKEEHWTEAGAKYDSVRMGLADWHSPNMRRAVEGSAACAVKLTRWDDAVAPLDAYITHNRDTLDEVAGQRLLAGFYFNMPHAGIVQGGKFLRGQSGQGSEKNVAISDEREAFNRLDARATWHPGWPQVCRLARRKPPGRRSHRRGSGRTSI